ncbi:hypothetical protein RYA05_05885 [Pseudomonas syringae pv. actinidiae]|nr:hypothetical protein [Pseudomonas syringae pv. actinidiae]
MDDHSLFEQLKPHLEACGSMLEATHLDRSELVEGEWSNEPDLRLWVDQETMMTCLVARHPDDMHLNGYVAVDVSHPLHGASLKEVNSKIRFPITNASREIYVDPNPSKIQTILNSSGVWWIGFDFMHLLNDVSPLVKSMRAQGLTALEFLERMHPQATYKNVEFATQRCEMLAKQLKQASHDNGRAQDK